MAKYNKDDIVAHAQQLAKMIAETEEVAFFKQAEAKIHENEKVQSAIKEIKHLQKQAVNFKKYGKEKALEKVEQQLDDLEAELDEIPIVQQFKQSQIDVNDLLQLISVTISNKVTDEIIASTGGDVLKGVTGAELRNKKSCH